MTRWKLVASSVYEIILEPGAETRDIAYPIRSDFDKRVRVQLSFKREVEE